MNTLRNALRGAAAVLAATVVTAGLAAAAIALLDLPFSLLPAVLVAAVGGPASLTSSIDTGFLPVALQGTVDVVPLGIAGPGAVVFAVVLLGSLRTPLRALAVRTAGAAGTAVVVLAVLSTAKSTSIDIPLPLDGTPLPTEAQLVIQPDGGSAVFTGLLALLVLAAGCALLTRLPYRRTVAATALAGPVVLIAVGLAVAAVVATRQPALAGVALLFGANAVLLAVLAAFGASSLTSVGGPLAQVLDSVAGRDVWLLGGVAPGPLRVAGVLMFVLVCTVALTLVTPEVGNRWRRAGGQALVAGTVLAVVLAVTAMIGAGSLDLGVSLAVFRTPLLALRFEPAVGWALLAGVVTGGLAGLAGSLTADVRWRAQQRLIRRIRAYG